MPKAKAQKQRHEPLHTAIEEGSGHLRKQARTKREKKQTDIDDDGLEEQFIDSATTKKILDLARQQREDIEEEEQDESSRTAMRDQTEFSDVEDNDEDVPEDAWEDEDDYEEYEELDIEVDPEEQAIFERYMGEQNEGESVNLADKIMEKVREMEMKQAGGQTYHHPDQEGVMLPPKVIAVYTQVGELLSRFRSGRLPRAFKIIPTLKNWRDVLYVTQPEVWSNQAMYEGSKLFVSSLKSNQAHKFVREVLLDRFRDQVRDTKTVNYHVYRALKKALYKPAAFFKGFLFPLLESGTCTLREAIIASSILARVSVPALHSSAALLRLTEMEYSGPNSLFIRVLLDKKYALPYKVVDGMVFHFIKFKQHEGPLPVIWHQSFLVFAQRYKNDITDDQREALMMVLRSQPHPSLSAEIRRELMAGTPREVEVSMQA